MHLYGLVGWFSLAVVCSSVVCLILWGMVGMGARPFPILLGEVPLGVVVFWTLYALYYEIKDRRSKKEQGKLAPRETKWFLEQAEWTFPVAFVLICLVGIIAWESIK